MNNWEGGLEKQSLPLFYESEFDTEYDGCDEPILVVLIKD